MKTFAVLCFIIIAVAYSYDTPRALPEEFLGTFKLEKDTNFDEYLKARGYNWFMRQMIKLASVTKVFRKAVSERVNRYDMENLTTKKDTLYTDWALGEPFVAEALDSTKHRITFDMKNDTVLVEKHHKLSTPHTNETYEYYRDGNYLVMRMEWDDVECKRYYVKIV